jgi:deoxyribonuclease-1
MAVNNLNTFLKTLFIFLTLLQLFSVYSTENPPKKIISFSKAKTLLSKKVYGNKGKTFYCGCSYQKKSVVGKSCKITTKKYRKRQKRLEWEHVVPAHAFGQSFKEWRESKRFCPKGKSPRKCAGKKNLLFKEMEGNLHNLVPAVGAINALRSNYSFTELNLSKSENLCNRGFNLLNRKVTPANDIKGDIARIYFYMANKYPGRGIISKKNQKMFDSWSNSDPVSPEECRLSMLKSALQGDQNLFVESKCKEDK